MVLKELFSVLFSSHTTKIPSLLQIKYSIDLLIIFNKGEVLLI